MKISEIKVSYSNHNSNRLKITNSRESYNCLISIWNKTTLELQEEFNVLFLNRNNEVLGIYPLSKGGTSSTIIGVKLLFSVALKCNASSIIVAHNHPSGNLTPSESDKITTDKIKKASNFLNISLLDHLIISKNDYYSFNDNGIM